MRRHFDQLPPPQLPAALWARVNAVRIRRISQRRRAAFATSALLALAIGLALRPSVDAPAVAPHALSRATGTAPGNLGADMPLATLDLEIQRAYNRGATDAEIAVLLSARSALVRDPSTKALPPVRI